MDNTSHGILWNILTYQVQVANNDILLRSVSNIVPERRCCVSLYTNYVFSINGRQTRHAVRALLLVWRKYHKKSNMHEQNSYAETILQQALYKTHVSVSTCFVWFFVIWYKTSLHMVGTAKFLPGIHKICISYFVDLCQEHSIRHQAQLQSQFKDVRIQLIIICNSFVHSSFAYKPRRLTGVCIFYWKLQSNMGRFLIQI